MVILGYVSCNVYRSDLAEKKLTEIWSILKDVWCSYTLKNKKVTTLTEVQYLQLLTSSSKQQGLERYD